MTRDDLLIIGGGPSGLFAAAELARHGVGARLIEREVRSHREARATAIEPGTLEILDSVGPGEQLPQHQQPLGWDGAKMPDENSRLGTAERQVGVK